jgi:hypothetical protein
VFKVADGTSWVARLDEGGEAQPQPLTGWQGVLFERSPHTAAQRLVYRPPGWLDRATPADLAAALEEGVPVRTSWGE